MENAKTENGTVIDRPLVILGAGGHAKVLLEAIRLRRFPVRGVVTPDKQAGEEFNGLPVLGGDDCLKTISPEAVFLVNGLGSTGILGRRKTIFDKFKGLGYSFHSIIHPSAIIANDVQLGEGVQIMAGAVIQPGSRIGLNCIVNTKASVDHDCEIGEHVHLAPGVTLSGGVVIEDCVHVGTGANLIQGIRIGKSSLVGAGALVIRNVPECQMVAGVPAKLAKTIKDWKKVRISPDTSIKEAIRIIDAEAMRIALVVDVDDVLLGTVTDGDVRRGILKEVSLSEPVSKIMNRKPVMASESDGGETILALMKNRSLHQIPVIDKLSRVIRVELLENLVHSKLL